MINETYYVKNAHRYFIYKSPRPFSAVSRTCQRFNMLEPRSKVTHSSPQFRSQLNTGSFHREEGKKKKDRGTQSERNRDLVSSIGLAQLACQAPRVAVSQTRALSTRVCAAPGAAVPVHACKIGQQQSDVRQRARAPSGSAPRLTAVDALVAIPSLLRYKQHVSIYA